MSGGLSARTRTTTSPWLSSKNKKDAITVELRHPVLMRIAVVTDLLSPCACTARLEYHYMRQEHTTLRSILVNIVVLSCLIVQCRGHSVTSL
jgi:hypothetical protein